MLTHTCFKRPLLNLNKYACNPDRPCFRPATAACKLTRSSKGGFPGTCTQQRGRRNFIQCMAHPRRVARVSKQIEREIGSLLLTDRVMQGAVCPEVKIGLDSALSAVASVTEVEVSNDLQVAKVYISIYSDPEGKDLAMRGLSRLEGYVRRHIARAINLRLCPEIRFIRDDSIQRGEEVLALLERIKKQEAGEIEPPAIAISGVPSKESSADGFLDDDFDDDEEDEDTEEQGAAASSSRDRLGLEEDDEIIDDLDDEEGFLDNLADEGDDEDEDDDDDDDDDDDTIALPDLDFMPSVEGVFAPTVREPWRSERELKRVRGRSNKGGRKKNSRRR